MDSETPIDDAQIMPSGPTILGGVYRLSREIHRSDSSIVHEAEHLVTTRQVALKVPRDAGRQARVASEAAALGRVDHRHVVRIYDARADGAEPFIAMELLHGRTLHGIVCTGRALAAETVATLGVEIAEGLSAIHAAGLMHGSLSTKNVLIARESGREVTKLLDFEQAGAPGLVPPGLASNVAPESRIVGQLDARSDLYALGEVLDECLHGAGRAGTDRLAGVVRHLLEARPESRPASARAVVEALTPLAGARLALLSPPLPTSKVTDLRKAPRASYLSPVRLFVGSRAVDGRTEDISSTGVLVVIRETIAAGTVVRMRFSLPIVGTVVECSASVAWTRAHPGGASATGLSFIEPPESLRTSVARYVAALEAGGAPRA